MCRTFGAGKFGRGRFCFVETCIKCSEKLIECSFSSNSPSYKSLDSISENPTCPIPLQVIWSRSTAQKNWILVHHKTLYYTIKLNTVHKTIFIFLNGSSNIIIIHSICVHFYTFCFPLLCTKYLCFCIYLCVCCVINI